MIPHRCRCLEVLEKGQVQLIRFINWAVYEEAVPALRCLSVLPLRCLTSGSDGVDQRFKNRSEPSPELNLQADSSVSHQRRESCPPSQQLLLAPSQRTRRSRRAILSYTTGSMTIPPGGFPCAYLQTVPVLFPVPRIICLN
ncbi:hypothetical protein XENOCAPTIV_004999 [Xenoophorus captivus]|uniref:Uncharacterized protein n=1 Tax=Xenoophorus captivus TaxID=1517983 RepID=A0ABV0S1H0_9TELE